MAKKYFIRFVFSRLFLKNLAIAFAIGVSLVLGSLLFLNIYTHHGESLVVPDFDGLTIGEAQTLAEDGELELLIVDSVYLQNYLPGTIVYQHPKSGYHVKSGRKIYLTRNAFNPAMVPMPDLVELSLRQSRTKLKSAGLIIGALTYVPDVSYNRVLEQMIEGEEVDAGVSVKQGTVIDLVVSGGPSDKKTIVPDLISLSIEGAENELLNASLKLGTITYDKSIKTEEDSLSAFVYKQSPISDEKVLRSLGSSIYIWITNDSTKLPAIDSSLILNELSQ